MPRPSTFLDWLGLDSEPSPAQKAVGFAVSQNPPAQAVNWLLQTVDQWDKYVDDYILTTHAAASAAADAVASQGMPYPLRELAAASTMTFASVSAAVDANGALLHVLAVGAAGKTLRVDGLTSAIVSSTWGVATDCNDVAYGNGRYLGCGAGGVMRSSTDGTTWSAHYSVGGSSTLYTIAYSADRTVFCAVGSNNAGTGGTTIAGNGVAAPTARALPNASDIPRRVVWVGGAIQAFFAFSLTTVYRSDNPVTDAWVQVGTFGTLTTIFDACWHPTIGIVALGHNGGNMRYTRSVDGTTWTWTASGYSASPLNAALLALPDAIYIIVANGSLYAASIFRLDTNTSPDPVSWADARYVLPVQPKRIKVLHNAVYAVGMRNSTDGSIYLGAPLEALRSYSRG